MKELSIGYKIYVLEPFWFPSQIKEKLIVKIDKTREEIYYFINDDNSSSSLFSLRFKNYGTLFFTSYKKASNVLTSYLNKKENDIRKFSIKQKNRQENMNEIKEIESTFLGAKILIKVEDGQWIKSKVGKIWPTYNKGDFGLIDTVRKNEYLLSKLGKNWKMEELT
jgi:hypothetical protein